MSTEVTYLSKDDAGLKRERKQVAVDREIERIYKRHKTVTTELLLGVASSPEHPLHSYFEWDDTVAANKYRQSQALAMIMASKMVVVLRDEDNAPTQVVGAARNEVRKLVSAFKGEGFKMRKEVLADEEQRKAMIERKKGDLRSWCRSVIDIEELTEIREALEGLL